MTSSLTSETIANSIFVCDCDSWARSACTGEPFYQEHEGKRYCVLHFPGKEKGTEFKEALNKKLDSGDFNFSEVWFPEEQSFTSVTFSDEAYFTKATFSAKVDFSRATFSDAIDFKSTTFSAAANFSRATFGDVVDFSDATFSESANFSDATFSSLTYFSDVTFSELAYFYNATFSFEVYFSNVTFSELAEFSRATFSSGAYFSDSKFSAAADFSRATFSAEADFSDVTFSAVADFNDVTFSARARFHQVTFISEADFSTVTFSAAADFSRATFSAEADFSDVTFSAVADFNDVTFGDYVKFRGQKDKQIFSSTSSLNLQSARIEKPDHVSFHTLALCLHWFVNVDTRKFDFTNVEWDWRSIREEVESLERNHVSSPHRMLAIACRHLAVNAEESHRYEEASKFRYMAMDARRIENRHRTRFWQAAQKTSLRLKQSLGRDWGVQAKTIRRIRRFSKVSYLSLKVRWQSFNFKAYLKSPRLLQWLYWAASGYGERVLQAFIVLIGVWLLFALLYTRVGFARWEPKRSDETDAMTQKRDEVGEELTLSRAFTYSLGVMTLQKPEPRPATTAAQSFVILETILGPLQAALLALAIRRKFMR